MSEYGDCGYDSSQYNEYDYCERPRRRHHHRRHHNSCWDYSYSYGN
jgi:hypothetical protein